MVERKYTKTLRVTERGFLRRFRSTSITLTKVWVRKYTRPQNNSKPVIYYDHHFPLEREERKLFHNPHVFGIRHTYLSALEERESIRLSSIFVEVKAMCNIVMN